MATSRNSAVFVLSAAMGAGAAWAQQPPDAGRLLDERKPPITLPRRNGEAVITETPIRPAMRAQAGVRFKVDRIRFSGNTVVASAELEALVQDVLGTQASLPELESAAERVTQLYQQRGFFVARAYVPAQDVKDGVVEIHVREGRLGEIEVDAQGDLRIASQRLERLVTTAVKGPDGSDVLRQGALERAMLLMNDLPGIEAQATLMPGTRQETTQLRVAVKEGPRATGSLGYDNHGNRFTGRNRPAATLNINDPAGVGDRARLNYSGLSDSPYLGVDYSLPIGDRGLRLAANLARTRYHLCCQFEALDATGSATVGGLQASYPIVRSRGRNLSASIGFEHRAFFNATVTGTTSDKTSRVLSVAASYDARDEWLGGGLLFANLGLTAGRLNLDGFAPDRAADDRSARSHGRYTKLNLLIARLQSLPADFALYVGLSAQYASKNLDSSEKMALGGPNAVRAYPDNEAAGDSAALLNLELRRALAEYLQGFAFIDYGIVQLHQEPWAGWNDDNPALRNHYRLAGGGLGIGYDKPGDYALRATLAVPIGSNPGRDAAGQDSDGAHRHTRLWLQALKTF